MLTGFEQSFGEGTKKIMPALVDEVEDSMKQDAATPAEGVGTR